METDARNHLTGPTDGQTERIVFQHDWTDSDELVGKIVSAVAGLADKDEADVERVYDRLDPESLNQLFSRTHTDRRRRDGLLVFSLEHCTVTVYGAGLVIVQG